uniref:Uncharacterized protein n=1 Tax=Amphimedon queenslandica TaxID=400682 RepID=A0A1X7SL33_AMPQE
MLTYMYISQYLLTNPLAKVVNGKDQLILVTIIKYREIKELI